MFFNEDGDLAHEFYEEVRSKKKKQSRMKKVDFSLLRPQVRNIGSSIVHCVYCNV